jgi:hypothetical protein
VDFERQQRGRPVPGSRPLRDGVEDGEVEQLAGGVLGREMTLSFDSFAELAVERLDRVGIRYERRLDAAVSPDWAVAAVVSFGLGEYGATVRDVGYLGANAGWQAVLIRCASSAC